MRVFSTKDRVEGCIVDHFDTVRLAHKSFVGQPPQSVHLSQAGKVAFLIAVYLCYISLALNYKSYQIEDDRQKEQNAQSYKRPSSLEMIFL